MEFSYGDGAGAGAGDAIEADGAAVGESKWVRENGVAASPDSLITKSGAIFKSECRTEDVDEGEESNGNWQLRKMNQNHDLELQIEV